MPVEDDGWHDDEAESASPPSGQPNVGPSMAPPVERSSGEQEAHPVTVVDRGSPEEPPAQFDPKHALDFEGLLYLGKLEHSFEYAGHKFRIKTLDTAEIIEVGLLHAGHRQSMAETKVWQAATLAASLITVDGKALAAPLTMDPSDTGLRSRFDQVARWFPPILDAVYEEYLLLEARAIKVLEAMGKASPPQALTRT